RRNGPPTVGQAGGAKPPPYPRPRSYTESGKFPGSEPATRAGVPAPKAKRQAPSAKRSATEGRFPESPRTFRITVLAIHSLAAIDRTPLITVMPAQA
ncbi:MAG: hypothetical protein FD153_1708, partial [Rhodospirillaceae bacterium]